MSVIVRGSELVKLPTVHRWSRDQGVSTGLRWEGTQAKVKQLRREMMQLRGADSVEVDHEGAKWFLTAWFSDETESGSAPDQNENVEIWELDINDVDIPVQRHSAFSSLTAQQAAIVIKAANEDPGNTAGVSYTSMEEKLRKLILQGTLAYAGEQYVVRSTQVTGWRSTVKASFANVGTVSTSVALSAEAKFALPEAEWLKRKPNVRRMGARRFEIVTEWWGADKWSAILYPGGTADP